MTTCRVGDRVRVKGYREHAIVESLYSDIKGGLRLDRRIGGFWSWNVADLMKVPASPAPGRRATKSRGPGKGWPKRMVKKDGREGSQEAGDRNIRNRGPERSSG
jgi:hypothetical protein